MRRVNLSGQLSRVILRGSLLIGVLSTHVFSQVPDRPERHRERKSFPPVADLPEVEGLPDLFAGADGRRAQNTAQWQEHRQYLKAMLAHYFYCPN